MGRYVIVEGGIVTNAIVSEADFAASIGAIASDEAGIGWSYDGDTFTPPETEEQPAPVPYLNNAGLVRFTGPAPVTVIENIRMTGVTRVSKGRYRAYHSMPYPSASYAVFPSVLDASPCQIRVSARTAAYAEVRVIDALGLAYDPQEVSIRTERVVTP